MKYEAVIEIPAKRVLDILLSGLETTMWCGVRNYDYRNIEKWFEGDDDAMLDVYNAYEDNQPDQLSKKKLCQAIQIMGEKHPGHLTDIVEESDDAITGDVLLQLALFGELIYG